MPGEAEPRGRLNPGDKYVVHMAFDPARSAWYPAQVRRITTTPATGKEAALERAMSLYQPVGSPDAIIEQTRAAVASREAGRAPFIVPTGASAANPVLVREPARRYPNTYRFGPVVGTVCPFTASVSVQAYASRDRTIRLDWGDGASQSLHVPADPAQGVLTFSVSHEYAMRPASGWELEYRDDLFVITAVDITEQGFTDVHWLDVIHSYPAEPAATT